MTKRNLNLPDQLGQLIVLPDQLGQHIILPDQLGQHFAYFWFGMASPIE